MFHAAALVIFTLTVNVSPTDTLLVLAFILAPAFTFKLKVNIDIIYNINIFNFFIISPFYAIVLIPNKCCLILNKSAEFISLS